MIQAHHLDEAYLWLYHQRQHYPFVMRTDVKAFYASIDHHLLLDKLAMHIKDRFTLNLLAQSMAGCVERGGLFRDIKRGVVRGCPLSPLQGHYVAPPR